MISIQKRGKVYQYRFEVARVNGKRKYLSKSGFKTKSQAFAAGQKAYDEYLSMSDIGSTEQYEDDDVNMCWISVQFDNV